MKLRGAVFTILGIAVLGAAAANARAQGHTIRGKVRNSSGVNLSQLTISLESGNGGLLSQTVTNNEGDFSFTGLTDNSYVISVSAPDYNPAFERVEFIRNISPNDPGEVRTIELTLVEKDRIRLARPGVTFVQNVPKAALDAFEQARKSVADRQSQKAQRSLETAIGIFPDYFDARFLLANELIKQGQLEAAIKHLNEAQRINPKDDRVWYLFGTVLMRQGKYAVAARVFSEAANLSSRDPEYPFMQGVSLINQASITQTTGDARSYFLAEAEKSLLKAYDLSGKKLHVVHLQLARVYEKRGDRNRAAQELEMYLAKNSNASDAAAIRDAIKKLRTNP